MVDGDPVAPVMVTRSCVNNYILCHFKCNNKTMQLKQQIDMSDLTNDQEGIAKILIDQLNHN